jgi:hypothetical protein
MEFGLQAIESKADAFFCAYQLIVPDEIRLTGGLYSLEGRKLIGSHLLHPHFSKQVATSPDRLGITENTTVYLCDAAMRSFSPVSPYIRLDVCPECRHQRVLMNDGGRMYIDVFVGHRIELD